MHLQPGLVDHRFDQHVCRALDVVFLDVVRDQIHKRLPEFDGLACAHPGDALELIEGIGVLEGHFFQRRLLEEHVRRQVFFLGHGLAQVLEHGQQLRIGGPASGFPTDHHIALIHIAEVALLDEHEGLRLFDKGLAFGSQFERAVGLNLLAKQSAHYTLSADGTPELEVVVFALSVDVLRRPVRGNLAGILAYQTSRMKDLCIWRKALTASNSSLTWSLPSNCSRGWRVLSSMSAPSLFTSS